MRRSATDSTRVTVTEGKHRKVNFGVGYGTEEKARGEVDWRHVNFFGGARTAGVFARYSSLDRGVRLNFNQPYFFIRATRSAMSGQAWFSDEPAYELTTIGGRVTITREFSRGALAILGAAPDIDARAHLRERVGGLHDLRTRRSTIRHSATS